MVNFFHKLIKRSFNSGNLPNKAAIEPNDIPGMIEPGEQNLLYSLTKSIHLQNNESIIEFGVFFGRSTRCIVNGLTNSESDLGARSSPALRVYDSFSCEYDGAFQEHVMNFAKQGKVTHLISKTQNKIHFDQIFDHYFEDIDSNILLASKCELAEMAHIDNSKIRLMHFDLPKWYTEYKLLLDKFSLHLSDDALLVYQDFFYHWSATLIMAVFAWIEAGILKPIETAATTLLVQVTKPINQKDIDTLDSLMAKNNRLELITKAISYFDSANFKIDRKESFLHRLWLAKLQYTFENEMYEESAKIMQTLLENKALQNSMISQDFQELMRFGFSLRKLYELDHG